jgi:thiol-disulfide isomerase/thioredoxin
MSHPTSTFHCTRCGRALFHAEDVIERATLWDLREYRADAYAVRRILDLDGLTRYDVSLHEGWYCCRFIVMRMTTDKFGTGDKLLVYVDSVVEVKAGEAPPRHGEDHGQLKLGTRDFDAVVAAPENRDTLLVVKLGALWCPPCRLMDAVIGRIHAGGKLPGVRFFEVDVDEEPELARRWSNQGIPFHLFYWNGQQVELEGPPFLVIDGGVVGGMGEAHLVGLCQRAQEAARRGETRVPLR